MFVSCWTSNLLTFFLKCFPLPRKTSPATVHLPVNGEADGVNFISVEDKTIHLSAMYSHCTDQFSAVVAT